MTEKSLYEIKDLFFRVRQFYYGAGRDTLATAGVDKGEAAEYIAALKAAEEKCTAEESEASLPSDAADMLSYTLSTVREALKEKNYRMAGDLSEVGSRLCGVYTFPCLSRTRFWEKYVLPLKDKHGEELFSAQEERFLKEKNTSLALTPSFCTRMRGARYYEEDSDAEMLEAHPVLYTLFAVFGMLLFIGAIVLYATLLSRRSAWDILGYLGAALVGVGLFSFPMAFIHQYMGHRLTFSLMVGGAICVALAQIF